MKTKCRLAVFFLSFLWVGGNVLAEVRTWTSAADPTKTFDAEFKSAEGDLVTLVTPAGKSMQVKLEILSEADNEFVKAQMAGEAPDPNPAAPTDPKDPADPAAPKDPVDPKDPAAPAAPAEPIAPLTTDELRELEKAPLFKAIKTKLVKYERKAMRRDTVEPAKYYLIYHGGSYSNPCFKAAPEIGTQYTTLVATNPRVEMIYVGHDKTEEQLEEMLAEFGVPIPALKFGELEDIELINKHVPERMTVPLYQLLDSNGELVESGEGLFEKLSALK